MYGKCIVADYNSVHKDKCLDDFLRLKNCYMVRHKLGLPLVLVADIAQAAAKKT